MPIEKKPQRETASIVVDAILIVAKTAELAVFAAAAAAAAAAATEDQDVIVVAES